MHAGVNHALAYAALAVMASSGASASDIDSEWGRNAWLPSLAITSGVLVQRQSALQQSFAFDGETNTQSFLRPPKYDNDVAVAPFVGGALEFMTPELPVPTGPRLFVAGEILPSFAPEREVQDDEPSRIRGPELDTVPAVEEDSTHFTNNPPFRGRRQPFSQEEVKGDGMRTRYEIKQMIYGAKAGVAWGFDLFGRELRIKPSVGWIHFDMEAKGLLVNATCDPVNQCTNTYVNGVLFTPGFVRESILSVQDKGSFDGVGPGVDLEMDTGRLGPFSTALFVGLAGYYIPGDRDIDFNIAQTYDDQLSPSPALDVDSTFYHVRVDPWLWRAGIGVRFFWVGIYD